MADSNLKALASLVHIEATSAYRFVQGEISWQDVVVSEITLGTESLNRYFRNEAFSFSDVASLSHNKTTLDSFGFNESQALLVQKALTDAFAFSDQLTIALTFFRDLDDSYALGDVSVLSIDKGVADSVPITEVLAMGLSTAKSDVLTMAEVARRDVSKAESDSVFMTDDFDRAVSYVRAFSDQFALDDAATVDAFRKDTGSNKVNVFTFADTQVFTVTKALADSISFSETTAFGTQKSTSDSYSVSDLAATSVSKPVSDGFTFSDAQQAALNLGKADSFTFVDLVALGSDKARSDSFAMADAFARDVSYVRAVNDSFTFGENVSVSLFTTVSSVLASSALNTYSLNS